MKREGETVAGISRKVGVSRDTVYKYLEKDDFSPEMPTRKPAKSIMDEYRAIIEGYLEEDARNWRKQRHTAKRIYERLRDEHPLRLPRLFPAAVLRCPGDSGLQLAG